MVKIKPSEITPEHVYLSRRKFMIGVGALAATATLAACDASAPEPIAANPSDTEPAIAQATTDELGDPLNTYEQITNYNNYYEFSTDKQEVASLAANFKTSPWTIEVSGLVNQPKTYDIDDLRAKFPQDERVYRLRCVEGWSMVIPWIGFPLNLLLKEADPKSSAKFVRFTSILDPDQMPGQRGGWFNWPYVEGLRLDEAMHDLTLAVTGLYGKPLPNQDGAPLRIAAPWKYGFKGAKAIVKIELVEEQPVSFWMIASPNEYGFYSNVNPNHPHPRWSQATERRIGEAGRRPTLMFNGYEKEVAQMYAGMDLDVNF
ncbi:MAG TPA: protein-methionine-sulfoxide reductase catalytic subunit MsrP [Anaerolineae bacterium]